MTLKEFKRFADENNIVPVSKEIYSQMISDSVKYVKIKEVLNKIRAEIESLRNANPSYYHSGDMVEREEVFEIIDKYREDGEE